MPPLNPQEVKKHVILKEIYKNYLKFKYFFEQYGQDVIDYGPISLSYVDLQYGVRDLPPRKKEAFFYNIVLDLKQKDAAERMGVTTVTVGQYVEQALIQLSKRYFADMPDRDIEAAAALAEQETANDDM